jgi:prepilin-type N-terminal cleavage/methylation domain-containing protein
VAIRPPKYNSQGYTLLEMLAVLGMVAVIVGFATPSFLALNKPLRNGTSQFVSQLGLIRSKAISSNQAYRLRPKYPLASQYIGTNAGQYNGIPRNFIVEFAANCRVTVSGGTNGWQQASQFDLDLPQEVGISDVATVTIGANTFSPPANLNWSICYDNRGMAFEGIQLTLKDFQGNNRAKNSLITITIIGQLDITTQDAANVAIPPDSANNPVY